MQQLNKVANVTASYVYGSETPQLRVTPPARQCLGGCHPCLVHATGFGFGVCPYIKLCECK